MLTTKNTEPTSNGSRGECFFSFLTNGYIQVFPMSNATDFIWAEGLKWYNIHV